ncbi:hypothetical protein [Frigoribacterium sp. VKM Ac-2530]|uniref:hypothetical protein n=1 Tax=Frigoribacterium sp. VKM Ac-2530 TaxID=2783822 RepID=UPI00188A2C77|nr:hypothetical protein [Frigoribacterium sp. VKM Ac-2530]MBF4580792.1 hypothetical protein [Frigoribacterium sp. VKM Ac-2530]
MSNPIDAGAPTGYTYLPVPTQHVPALMEYLVSLGAPKSVTADEHERHAPAHEDFVGQDAVWADELLRRLASDTLRSAHNAAAAMTVIARKTMEEGERVWVGNDDLAAETGIDPVQMPKVWSGFGRYISNPRNGYPAEWPLATRTASRLPDGKQGDARVLYSFRSVERAKRWLQITTEE